MGPAQNPDEEVWRGDRESGEFSVWYLEGGKVAGCLSVERSEDLGRARDLLAAGTDVSGDRDKIADPGVDLAEIG